MTKYKRTVTKNNRVMYFIDGNMKSKESISTDILLQLEETPEVSTSEETVKKPKTIDKNICIVCGEPATHQKYVMGEIYGVCTDDYYKTTTGKLVQIIRNK